MRYLVTGAFGFIGSHLATLLSKRGDSFVVVDSGTYAAINRDAVISLDGFEDVVENGVEYPSTWEAVERLGTFDTVLHLAAETHVDRSIGLDPTTLDVGDLGGPYAFLRSNVEGTARVASYCTATSTPLVHVSTDEVYGDAESGGVIETFDEEHPFRPSSPYSASKCAAEEVLRAWRRTYDLRYAVVRPSNAFGLGQTTDKLIPVVVRFLDAGEPVPLYAGGGQLRQWVHASDIARGIVLASERGRLLGEAYNLGGDTFISNLELVDLFVNVVGGPIKSTVSVADRPGHDFAYRISSRRARDVLEWNPTIPLVERIGELFNGYS